MIDVNPEFDYFLPWTLLWGIWFLFSRPLKCTFKLLVWEFCNFFWRHSELWTFLLTLLSLSHKFGCVVPDSDSMQKQRAFILQIHLACKGYHCSQMATSRETVYFIIGLLNCFWDNSRWLRLRAYYKVLQKSLNDGHKEDIHCRSKNRR